MTEQQKGEEQWVELDQTAADGEWERERAGEEGEGAGSLSEEEELLAAGWAVVFAERAHYPNLNLMRC